MYRHKNVKRVRQLVPKIEDIERKLKVFEKRQSAARCLECGSTTLLEIQLPAFEKHTRTTVSFLHPGCSTPMILIDGDETSTHMSIAGDPRQIEAERAILLTKEGERVQPQKKQAPSSHIDDRLKRLMELDQQAEAARQLGNESGGAAIYSELIDQLLPEATEFAERFPHSAKAHHFLGRTCRVLQLYEAAVTELEKSIEIDPKDYMPLAEITMCLGRLGQFARAKRFAAMGVEVAPHLGGAWSNFAMILHAMGDNQTAVRYARKAMELDPDDPAVRQAYSTLIH